MKVEYGQIKKYKPKQGYGFITRTFSDSILQGKKDVYFHIKTIKYNFPDLARQLDEGSNTSVHFWDLFDTNERGAEAIRIWLDVDNIPDQYKGDLIMFINRLWTCGTSFPSEAEQITIDLGGKSRRKELKESYGDPDSILYLLLEITQEMERKRYKPRKRIKDAYDGLPDELIDVLLWVKMKYQTNPLSHMPGGSDVVIERHDGGVFGYRRIKDYAAYIETILCELIKLSKYEFRKLDLDDRMEIAEDLIHRIFVRKSRTMSDDFFSSFVEVWNSDTSVHFPTYALKKYRKENLEAVNMKS